jgi:hypothetical protein
LAALLGFEGELETERLDRDDVASRRDRLGTKVGDACPEQGFDPFENLDAVRAAAGRAPFRCSAPRSRGSARAVTGHSIASAPITSGPFMSDYDNAFSTSAGCVTGLEQA